MEPLGNSMDKWHMEVNKDNTSLLFSLLQKLIDLQVKKLNFFKLHDNCMEEYVYITHVFTFYQGSKFSIIKSVPRWVTGERV